MNISPADLYHRHQDQFERYLTLLLKWNEKINLTAITKPDEMRELHFIDSLSVVREIVSRETLLDIGAGAGFPGIPIKIVCPDLDVTLVESVKKKCDFMKAVIRELGLERIHVIYQRLSARNPLGRFDIVISRAAFKYTRLLELALPNLAPDGIIIGMKGPDVRQEVLDSERTIDQGHLKDIAVVLYSLYSGQKRTLLITSPS